MDGRISWSAMEADCLVEIFMKLGLDDLILSVPFVCKSWLAAVCHPLCWKKLDFRQLDVLPWSNFSKTFTLLYSLPYFSFTHLLKLAVKLGRNSVTELSLPLKFISSEDLEFISNECPKLKSVALPILSSDNEILFSELMRKWKDLERLELKFNPSNFAELLKNISHYCNKFSELTVSGKISGEDAMAIVSFLPEIKKLNLSGSFLPKKVLLVIVEGCKELQELNVNGCVGFKGDDSEIRAKVSAIREFKDKHCKLYLEDAYECIKWDKGFRLNGYIL
ncbi:F-box/LRR-repeat protein At3g48880-like [Phalaenopsis equestris]|uniref:F-box/LRR-repeat protein At3g48880-like n=1 Tax=Phalaenopsis equestris TaxID=78828 RepID=UPI0009E4822C|nr:F-box/LRR-repeat protein At3g48880-like [Phalaenopsis equestris]